MKVELNKYNSNLVKKEQFDDSIFTNINDYLIKYKENLGFHNNNITADEINDINNTAEYIRRNCDLFLVIGIGGSYMGSLAVIESLKPYFYNEFEKIKLYFAGTSLSKKYIQDLEKLIINKNIILNVISKSGSTLEVKLAYELIEKLMKNKYSNDELKKRIIITTEQGNSLWNESIDKGYKLYEMNKNIGGRFSVFTVAGLLPIAVSGLNISELIRGSKDADNFSEDKFLYALLRDSLYKRGKIVEAYVVYEPKLYYITEWLKQLYSESLGKKNTGILPISVVNTRDLHSLGQFFQEGPRILFETNILFRENNGLNEKIVDAVGVSHNMNEVVINNIMMDRLDEYNIGYLLQFFMISVSISGYIADVNAFNQEGVEIYKDNLKKIANL